MEPVVRCLLALLKLSREPLGVIAPSAWQREDQILHRLVTRADQKALLRLACLPAPRDANRLQVQFDQALVARLGLATFTAMSEHDGGPTNRGRRRLGLEIQVRPTKP